VVDTDERVYRDSLLTDLTDLAEFVQNHRPTAPWPPTPRSLRGMATYSRWRARVGSLLSGGSHQKKRTATSSRWRWGT